MTAIQWTDITDNVIVAEGGGWYCQKISPGCLHCYAEKLNQNSFFGGNLQPYSGEAPPLKLKSELMQSWAKMRSPKKHFVSSMTDVFAEWVPREWQFEMLDAMVAAPLQTFQVLTKRPRIMAIIAKLWMENRGIEAPQNIWMGASVEDQQRLEERRHSLQTLKRLGFTVWYSVEPLLENVSLKLFASPVDWVVVGGESGKGARQCDIQWVLSVVDQCRENSIPVFVKQLGQNAADSAAVDVLDDKGHLISTLAADDSDSIRASVDRGYNIAPSRVNLRLAHPKGGDISEFPDDLKVRQFPGECSVTERQEEAIA